MLGMSIRKTISEFKKANTKLGAKILSRPVYEKDIRDKQIMEWLTTGIISMIWDEAEQCCYLYLSPNQKRLGIEVGHFMPDDSGIVGFSQHSDPRVERMYEKLTAFFMTIFKTQKMNLRQTIEISGSAQIRRNFNSFEYTAFKTL